MPPQSRYPGAGPQRCRSLLSIGGDNLQFYPDFALFSTLGGMNLDHDFVQVSKLNEDQEKNRFSPKMEQFFPRIQVKTKNKKGLHQRWNTFFPNSSAHLRSNAHQSQINGGMKDVDHTQTIGGDTVKLLEAVADLENFGGGMIKFMTDHKLCIISKFWMFMINGLNLAQTCWGYF